MMYMGGSRKSHRKERERERQTERNRGRSTAFFTVHGVSIFNCMRFEQHVLRTKVQCLQIYGTLTQMASQVCIHGMGEEMGMFSLDDSGVSCVRCVSE